MREGLLWLTCDYFPNYIFLLVMFLIRFMYWKNDKKRATIFDRGMKREKRPNGRRR